MAIGGLSRQTVDSDHERLPSIGQPMGCSVRSVDVEVMGRAIVTIWARALITATQFGLDGLERELASIRTLIEAALVRPPVNGGSNS